MHYYSNIKHAVEILKEYHNITYAYNMSLIQSINLIIEGVPPQQTLGKTNGLFLSYTVFHFLLCNQVFSF